MLILLEERLAAAVLVVNLFKLLKGKHKLLLLVFTGSGVKCRGASAL